MVPHNRIHRKGMYKKGGAALLCCVGLQIRHCRLVVSDYNWPCIHPGDLKSPGALPSTYSKRGNEVRRLWGLLLLVGNLYVFGRRKACYLLKDRRKTATRLEAYAG